LASRPPRCRPPLRMATASSSAVAVLAPGTGDSDGAADEGGPPEPVVAPGVQAGSLLFSSLGDPQKGFPGYCARTPPDWTGEHVRRWPGRHSEVCAPFREACLRAARLGEDRGRSLVSGAAVRKGEAVCQAQPPLALHQYDESKRICEVCAHCNGFVGSLRSALSRPLAAAAKGADGLKAEDLVDELAALEELEAEEWTLRPRLLCEDGCGEVFCSSECMAAARTEGWHRVLCTDLPAEKRRLWGLFRKHANKHHELFILAAQVIAEIVCLVRHHGADLYQAMAFFTRFAKMSWLSMLHLPSRSHTQGFPQKGPLVEMAKQKTEHRLEVVVGALQLLVAMLWERRFAELLTVDFFSNLVGQFSLSNVWVQIEHPLSARFAAKMKSDPEFRTRYARLAEASVAAARKVAPPDTEDANPGPAPEDEQTWKLPRFEASGLYVCCALSNHSCRPNFTMRYGDDKRATMVALRDIKEGEELNLAYVSPSYELTERLTSLWRHWGFVCTCQKCQDELMERALKLGEGANENGLLLSPAGAQIVAGLCHREPPEGAAVEGAPPSPSAPSSTFRPAARLAAAATAKKVADEAAADEEDEHGSDADEESEEEEEEESDDEGDDESEDASDDYRAAAQAGFEGNLSVAQRPYANPLGPRGVPPSVMQLEADLRRLMESLQEPAPAG